MGAWSDATNSSNYPGQFLNRSSLAEFFEAAKLRDPQVDISHLPGIIQENINPAMTLKPGKGVNANPFHGPPPWLHSFSIQQ